MLHTANNITAHLGTWSGTSTDTTLVNQARAAAATTEAAMKAIGEAID